MRFLLLVAIILFAFIGHAFEVHKKDGRVLLQDSCSDGAEIVKSLSDWLRKTQPAKSCQAPSQTHGASCQYDITECLPEQVVRYQDANPKVDGPNCWNLALVMGKILPNLRFSSPGEMAFYMRPPLCRQLKDSEPRQAGDIGAIREVAWGVPLSETHGFVYISDKMVYSKNGPYKENPFALQSMDEMYENYKVQNNPKCRKNEIARGSNECSQAVSFYRCESMEEYLKKNPQISPELKEIANGLGASEQCLENHIFSGSALSSANLRDLKRVSGALAIYCENAKKASNLKKMSEADQFMVGGLLLRLEAIASQLKDMKDNLKAITGENSMTLTHSFEDAIYKLNHDSANGRETDEPE